MTNLMDVANAWLQDDPDPLTRAQTLNLMSMGRRDPAVLADYFGSRLQFGTAGLRGKLGPGPNRMNRLNVRKVSAGLADYVGTGKTVVIGYDGRHGSLEFAHDAASVMAARGLVVHLYDRVSPTPELAHAVTFLGADAGVMVTASHNPPQDNGYKVYWSDGAQIIPPHDTGISKAIDAVTDITCPPVSSEHLDIRPVPEAALEAYLSKVAALRVHDATGVKVVYTAMHGVGWKLVETVLTAAGHTELHAVPEQRDPDPDFSTVSFPNPEEPGALDLAKELATSVGAHVIVANDPDADRLAVCVPTDDGFRQLTGNQVGCLLAWDLLTHGPADRERLVATTIVSSVLLSRMADKHGAAYAECLTGFKWIANRAIAHDAAGGHFVMGYEEALGYSVGPVVRDKDGVSATLLLVDLVAWLHADGRTLLDALTDLYREYGAYASAQKSIVLPGAEGKAKIEAMLTALRGDPPTFIGGVEVVKSTDVLTGTWTSSDGGSGQVDLPASNVLAWDLADGSRVLARPSGTEPKIKFYFEVCEPMTDADSLADAENRAQARLSALRDDFLARVAG